MTCYGRIGVADRAGGPSDLSRCASQPKALIPCAGWPRWTEDEIRRVRDLAAMGLQSPQIAKMVGRTASAVSAKCTEFGIKLARQRHFGTAPADRSIWNEADKLSMFANIPHELADFVVANSRHFNIDLKTLRSSLKTADMVKCRNHIAKVARQSGYSLPVIGRAINRDPSTVRYAVAS